MSRRKYYRVVKCTGAPVCPDYARYEYDTARDYKEAYERNRLFTCSKCSRPNGVLSSTNLRTEWTSPPSKPLEKYPEGPYRSFGGHGVLIGPGYYAEGKDFPIGTRIKITAEVILPRQGDLP